MVLNPPALTICIPTHALTHLIMQSLKVLAYDADLAKRVEVIVVYDGAPVNNWATDVAAVQNLNLKQVSMAKAGPAAARNLAASLASAEQLIFCDSDVLITPAAVRAAALVPPGKLMVPRIDPIAQNNQVADFFSEYVFAPKHENGYDYVVSAFWGMSKSDFDAVGGFDERFRYPAGEDLDFIGRWNDTGRSVQYVEDVVVFHRNPTTLKELLDRAHRYGRHGDLGPQAAPAEHEKSADKAGQTEHDLAAPTWLDLILFPVALVVSGLHRVFQFAESQITSLSLVVRNRVRSSGKSWLALPRFMFEGPRMVVKLIGFTFALMTGMGSYPVHGNRRLTALWLASWQIGRLRGSARSRSRLKGNSKAKKA